MTVAQKVGQVIQPSITTITPANVRTYGFGSVLKGGGGWPGDVRKAAPKDWLALTGTFHEVSMDTPLRIPVMCGVDAVHGHNNIVGATLFSAQRRTRRDAQFCLDPEDRRGHCA